MKDDVPFYLEAHWDQYLKELFEEPDRSAVLNWLKRHSGEGRVIIVGAGFTRNVPGGRQLPLWSDQTRTLKSELGLPPDAQFSDLDLPDIFAEQRPTGKHPRDLPTILKELIPDEQLKPGRAHEALWASNPVAVITANCLDTTLEKSPPKRFRRVVDDTELGPKWGEDRQCPLIYFHGHRDQPETWVTGRRHYEAIEREKPILTAKVRQLIAEYPVLIVGYSLSDPDFHSIYHSTAEAMNNKHPGALALMRSTVGAKRRERELSNDYWRRNGLSIVSFKPEVCRDLDEAHSRFFQLTLKPGKNYQFSKMLAVPETAEDVARCLQNNIRAATSALDCKRGDEPEFLATDDARRRAWRAVLECSVLPEMKKVAEKKSEQANVVEDARNRLANGEQVEQQALRPPIADEHKWLYGNAERRKAARELLRFLKLNSNEIWLMEQLIGSEFGSRKALRDLIWDWLLIGFQKELHYFSSDESGLLAVLGILIDGVPMRRQVWARLARDHSELLRAAKVRRPRKLKAPVASKVTTLLCQAREDLLLGRRSEAREAYQSHLDQISTKSLDSFEEQIQGFFAIQGLLEAKEPFEYGKWLRDVESFREAYQSTPKVNRWIERVKGLGRGISKKRDGHRANGFESTSFQWSVAPRELHGALERAEQLGCPPFWLRDNLLRPLLAEIPDAREELRLRLRYVVKDTGKWVEQAVEDGEFEVNRASPVQPHPTLGAASRRLGQLIVSRAVCAFQDAVYSNRMEAFKQAHGLICKKDVRAALRMATSAQVIDRFDDARFSALCVVAHLTDWNRVSKPLLRVLSEKRRGERDYFELHRVLPSFPWEQWIRCDNFLAHGGLEMVALTCSTPRGSRSKSHLAMPFASNVGYTLSNLVHLDPHDRDVQRMAHGWLRLVANHGSTDHDQLRAATLLVGQLGGDGRIAQRIIAQVKAYIAQLEQRGKAGIALISLAVRAKRAPALHEWADPKLCRWATASPQAKEYSNRGFGRSDVNDETSALVFLVKHHDELRAQCRQRLFSLMDISWEVLPHLGEILAPSYWEEDWEKLRNILAFEGRKRDVNSWQLERFSLINAVTFDDLPEVASLHPECQFLYRAALDAISHNEQRVANSATYAALLAAPFFEDEADQKMVALALRSAADDPRISVAHGAAFAAGYWRGLKVQSPILRDAAQDVRQFFQDDPAAIIHRQYNFGLAKGKLGRAGGALSADRIET